MDMSHIFVHKSLNLNTFQKICIFSTKLSFAYCRYSTVCIVSKDYDIRYSVSMDLVVRYSVSTGDMARYYVSTGHVARYSVSSSCEARLFISRGQVSILTIWRQFVLYMF